MSSRVIPFKPHSSDPRRTTLTIAIYADGSTVTSVNTIPTDSERYALLRAIRRLRHEILARYTGTTARE